MSEGMSRREAVEHWYDKQTDENAWLTKTYKEIAAEVPCAISVARTQLAIVAAERQNVTPSMILKRRREYRMEVEGRLTDKKKRQIVEWHDQDVPLIDMAFRLEVDVQTIRNYLDKLGLDRIRKPKKK